jgi:serine/threonine-protein kinase
LSFEPRRFGKYELLETVGSGGMATVYRATDPDLQREVAVKVLHPHLCTREESRVRFRREARAVARLRHPAILEVFDAGEDEGRPYIVSEFIPGGSLEGWTARRRPLPPEVVAAVGIRVAEGLAVAHQNHIVHRDLKPGNILMGGGGRIKIADFGIAQVVDHEHLTSTGQILGSPAFMSPEHLEGAGIDARADIFSFGTLLYWLATDELPFTGPNAHVVLRRVLEAQFPDPARVRPEIGETLADVIRTCLQRAPERRYASMNDVASALRAALALSDAGPPVEMLTRFEADPDDERTRIRERRTAALLERCRLLRRQRGADAEIRRHCGWILAYDPEHREALRLVEETMSRRQVARIAAAVAATTAAAAIAAVLYLLFRSTGTAESPPAPPDALLAAADAAPEPTADAAGASPRPRPVEAAATRDAAAADGGAGPPTVEDVGPAADEGGADAEGPDVPGLEAVAPETVAISTADAAAAADVRVVDGLVRPPVEPLRVPRMVAFRSPVPCNNVEIRIDGRVAGVWGPPPGILQTELPTGPHDFEYRPLTPNCYPEVWSETIPAGDGPYAIARRLRARPGRLRVLADGLDATVDVLGRASGRTEQWMEIPFEDQDGIEVTVRVAVTFPGAAPVRRDVAVRAGEPTEIRVDPPSSGVPPGERGSDRDGGVGAGPG